MNLDRCDYCGTEIPVGNGYYTYGFKIICPICGRKMKKNKNRLRLRTKYQWVS